MFLVEFLVCSIYSPPQRIVDAVNSSFAELFTVTQSLATFSLNGISPYDNQTLAEEQNIFRNTTISANENFLMQQIGSQEHNYTYQIEVLEARGMIDENGTLSEYLEFEPIGNRLVFLTYSFDMVLTIGSLAKVYLLFRAIYNHAFKFRLTESQRMSHSRALKEFETQNGGS